MLANIPAISGLDDITQGRVLLQQAGRVVHSPMLTSGFLDAVTPRMFGASGDGVKDDSPAWAAALATGRPVRGDGPGYVYRLNSTLTGGNCDIDLQGSTLKPNGNIRAFNSNAGATGGVVANPTVSSGATQGSRSIVVSAATGLAVGQWVFFSAVDANYSSGSFPPGLTRIYSISGTTIELENALPVTYSGTITMFAYTIGHFYERFSIRNGILDGTDSTYTDVGAAINLSRYESVDIDVEMQGFDSGSLTANGIECLLCIDVRVRLRSVDVVMGLNHLDISIARSVTVPELVLQGRAFAVNFSQVDMVAVGNIVVLGQDTLEREEGLTSLSHRGVKVLGCAHATFNNIISRDYHSGFKFDGGFKTIINNIYIINSGLGDGLNLGAGGTLSNTGYLIVNNAHVANCKSIGVLISPASAGQVLIGNLIVKECGDEAVYASSDNIHINNAIIENWDRDAGGKGAINIPGGGIIDNVTFISTDATDPCINDNFTAGRLVAIGNTRRPSGNPLFSTAKFVENKGTAAIPSGSTSIAVTHNMIRTPVITEIQLTPGENPTNDPGNIWVSGISSTQFTINCRADPGASNYDIGWRIKLEMPFTA